MMTLSDKNIFRLEQALNGIDNAQAKLVEVKSPPEAGEADNRIRKLVWEALIHIRGATAMLTSLERSLAGAPEPKESS